MSLLAALLPFAAGVLARATLVLLATAAALLALRRASAATRHRVATAGLAAAVALPALALVLPKVPTRYLPKLPGLPVSGPGLGFVVLALWAAGLAAVVARLVVGTVRVRRLSREATSLRDAEWIEERDAAARRLELSREVALKESADVPVAITSGWRRPFLLVGRVARHWAVERRRIVLLHELAHVKRADWPALLLAELAAAVYWFHPLAIWLVRRVRREAEQACDELVIATGTKPSVYAGHLLGIFRSVGESPAPAAAALAMVRPHHFESRLRAILEPRAPMGREETSGSFALAGLLTFSLGALLLVPCNAGRPLAGLRRLTPATTSAKKPCPHSAAGSTAKTVAQTRTETRTKTRIATNTETVPAAAAETPDPDQTELPTLPEEGRSFPAIWRVDAKESPAVHRAATGFVLASKKPGRSHQDGGDWYDEGMRQHRRGHYAEAIEDFQKAIAADYRVDAASYNIACGYALLGNKDQAFEWLRKALGEGFDLAGYLRGDDDLENLHGDPRWAEIRKVARESDSKDRSVVTRYERLVAKPSSSGEAYYEVGRDLLRVDEYALAAKAFQQSADRGHRVGTSLYNEACALSLDGRKDAALDTLQKALDAGFDQPDMFRHDDDLDAIRSDPRFDALAKEAKELSLPGYGIGIFNIGRHTNRAKWREAAKRFEAYTAAHPEKGRGWYNLGFARLAGDRADEAAAPFQRALDLGYRKPETMYNLACTYARLDQKDAAFDWLFKALDAGFDEESTLRHDDDLDNLRGDSRYRKAVEIARARERSGSED
jgi:beta-lactamase regulating signal transducer with metallopeptidase domain/tetratricopeptide (TPR) repeat protein